MAKPRKRQGASGKSLSAVMSEALSKQRQVEAWSEVRGWALEGQAPITAEELDAVEREWKA